MLSLSLRLCIWWGDNYVRVLLTPSAPFLPPCLTFQICIYVTCPLSIRFFFGICRLFSAWWRRVYNIFTFTHSQRLPFLLFIFTFSAPWVCLAVCTRNFLTLFYVFMFILSLRSHRSHTFESTHYSMIRCTICCVWCNIFQIFFVFCQFEAPNHGLWWVHDLLHIYIVDLSMYVRIWWCWRVCLCRLNNKFVFLLKWRVNVNTCALQTCNGNIMCSRVELFCCLMSHPLITTRQASDMALRCTYTFYF